MRTLSGFMLAAALIWPLASGSQEDDGMLSREDGEEMGQYLRSFGKSIIDGQIDDPNSRATIETIDGGVGEIGVNVPKASTGGSITNRAELLADTDSVLTFPCVESNVTRMTTSGLEFRFVGGGCSGDPASVLYQVCDAPLSRGTQCAEDDYLPAGGATYTEASPEEFLGSTEVSASIQGLSCLRNEAGVLDSCQMLVRETTDFSYDANSLTEEGQNKIAESGGRSRASQIQRIRQGGQSESFNGETVEHNQIYDFRRDVESMSSANEGRESAIRSHYLATGEMSSGLANPETGEVSNYGPLSLDEFDPQCENECIESTEEVETVTGFCDASVPVFNYRNLHDASEVNCEFVRPTYDESCTTTTTFDPNTGLPTGASGSPCQAATNTLCWRLRAPEVISETFTDPVCPAEPDPDPEAPPCVEPTPRLISQTVRQDYRCDENDNIPPPCDVPANCERYRNYCNLEEGIDVRNHAFYGACQYKRERSICMEEFRECTTESDNEVAGGCVNEGMTCNEPRRDPCYYFGGMSGELPDSEIPECYGQVCEYLYGPGGSPPIYAPHLEDEAPCNTAGFSQACIPDDFVVESCIPEGCVETSRECVDTSGSGAGDGPLCSIERQNYQCQRNTEVCTATETVCRDDEVARPNNNSMATGLAGMAVLNEFGKAAGACGFDPDDQFTQEERSLEARVSESARAVNDARVAEAANRLACGLFATNCPEGRGGGMMLDKMTDFAFPRNYNLVAKADGDDPRDTQGTTPPCIFRIFDGIGERCRKPIGSSIQLAADCCDAGLTKEKNRVLNACNVGDIRIANARRSQSNVFMGTRCTSSIRLGFGFRICIERSEWHCLYPDQFARDIHVQGRAQLAQLAGKGGSVREEEDFALFGDDSGWIDLGAIGGYQLAAWRWPSICADPEKTLPDDAAPDERIAAHRARFEQVNRGENQCAASHDVYVAACSGPDCAPLTEDPRSGAGFSNWDIRSIPATGHGQREAFDAGISVASSCEWVEGQYLCDLHLADNELGAGAIRAGEIISWKYRTIAGGAGDPIYFGPDMVITPIHVPHDEGESETVQLGVGRMNGPQTQITINALTPDDRQDITIGGTEVSLIGGCESDLNFCRFEASYQTAVSDHPWFTIPGIDPPWGGADLSNMRCEGFTVEQFAALDFDSMDLYSSLIRDDTEFAEAGEMESGYSDSANEFVTDFESGSLENREGGALLLRMYPSDGQTPWEATIEVDEAIKDNTHPSGERPVTSVEVEWDDHSGATSQTSITQNGRFVLRHLYESAPGDSMAHVKRNNVVVTVNLEGAPPRVMNLRAMTWEDERPMSARHGTRTVNDGINEIDPRAGATGEVPEDSLGRQF